MVQKQYIQSIFYLKCFISNIFKLHTTIHIILKKTYQLRKYKKKICKYTYIKLCNCFHFHFLFLIILYNLLINYEKPIIDKIDYSGDNTEKK